MQFLPYDLTIALLDIYLREIKTYVQTNLHMDVLAVVFIAAKYLSVGEWLIVIRSFLEYRSAMKSNKLLMHRTTWVNYQRNMLRKIIKKLYTVMIPFIYF